MLSADVTTESVRLGTMQNECNSIVILVRIKYNRGPWLSVPADAAIVPDVNMLYLFPVLYY